MSHSQALGSATYPSYSPDAITQNLSELFIRTCSVTFGGRIGNLMDVTSNSINPKSHDGKNISDLEKDKIHRAIKEVEDKIALLKISIK